MKRTLSIFVVLLFMIVGCEQTPVLPSETQILTKTPLSLSTDSPNTLAPSQTAVATLPAATSSPIDKCLSVGTDYPTGLVSKGILVLGDDEYKLHKIYMDSYEKFEISRKDEIIFDAVVSPDRNWMAYFQYPITDDDGKKLIVVDFLGQQQFTIPWERGWGFISSWLDSKTLLIGVDTTSMSDVSMASRTSTFLALNPFTGERHILSPNFPNVYDGSPFGVWSGSGLGVTAYNTLLDRVVYLQGDSGIYNYVLWDIDQSRSIANFGVVIEGNAIPRWSPDGSKFAFAPSLNMENLQQRWPAYELYSVNRDGQVTQLTHLADYYPYVYIDDYSWSPDGRYISFWFSWWSEPLSGYGLLAERYLAIVDTKNNEVTNYCIDGDPDASGRVPLPVWSPNGKQLVVESYSSEGHSRVVLIDLEGQLAVQIGEDMKPVGWMDAP